MKFASFFIHVENGRRRPGRSARSGIWVSSLELYFRRAGRRGDEADLTPNPALINALKEKRRRVLVMFVPWGCGVVSVVAIVSLDKGRQRM